MVFERVWRTKAVYFIPSSELLRRNENVVYNFLRRMRRKIPVGYLKKAPREPLEWGWASPAGGMFTSIEDIAKVTSNTHHYRSTEHESLNVTDSFYLCIISTF